MSERLLPWGEKAFTSVEVWKYEHIFLNSTFKIVFEQTFQSGANHRGC